MPLLQNHKKKNKVQITETIQSFTLKRPSADAAPPGISFVMYIDVSVPTCGLSVPPAIENPKPEFPLSSVISSYCQLSSPLT